MSSAPLELPATPAAPRLPRAARIDRPHRTGRHCASTALSNLVHYHGIPWSEALCFGLGGGLGIWYVGLPGLSLRRIVHCRSDHFESRFFDRIGASFRWEHGLDAPRSEAAIKQAIVEQRLPILLVDIYDLPYLDDIHFPGHVICAWAYDDDAEEFYVSDMHRSALQAVPYAAMARARVSTRPPVLHDGHHFAPNSLGEPDDLTRCILDAIVENSRRLRASGPSHCGLRALETWQHELSAWPQWSDWPKIARFAYEVIETRGSGGGGFRLMYAEFLAEASARIPAVAHLELPERMHAAGQAWTALARALRDASRSGAPEFSRVADRLADVRAAERAYHDRAIELDDR